MRIGVGNISKWHQIILIFFIVVHLDYNIKMEKTLEKVWKIRETSRKWQI